jgi:hypothetical protein
MASPYTGGSELDKLFRYAQITKGNSDKASIVYAQTHAGKGTHDLSGATAVPLTNLPRAGASGAAHSSR